jgi:2-hydroxyglutarate dehydrogenase
VSQHPDVAVVGAGIVGLAVARELLERRPGRRVTVLEREDGIGRHQTGQNSGVIHAGIYYQPGSLKAQLCVEGARRMYAFCERHGVAHERVGKLIVATRADELGRLDELERRGRANGVPGLKRLDAAGVREIEPHCTSAIAGLHSPATGIADFPGVARALADEVRERGGEVVLGAEVRGLRKAARGVHVELASGEQVQAGGAVVCAGLWGDALALAAGAPRDVRIVPFRGGYLKLTPEAAGLVRGLIYPVPDPDLPFLGVHLTRHISGEVWLGPTALLVGGLRWPGTYRVMRRFWRTGLDELRMAASRRAFAAACRTYVPALAPGDVAREPAGAGVRAQAVGRDGALVDDFLLHEADATVHVRNAPSPAATSSLALAELIADRVESSRS